MAKSTYFRHYCFGLLVIIGFGAHGQALKKAVFPTKPIVTNEAELRRAILDTGKTQLKLREKPGAANNNRHPQITIYNRAVGVPDNAFYCASGGYWCHLVNGVRLPLSAPAAVRSWFADPKKQVKWQQGQRVQVFDAVSLFRSHVEFVADPAGFEDEDEELVQLIGWNTTGGSQKQQGCHLNWRSKSWIKAVANHITPFLKNQHGTAVKN
ncbi:hypothetical protein P1X15_10000 [Runella sp. MFBS21]|uniref:hypothetical protein n=1 Tax=Runella sp. MFBS21 TaxID=3034018 RepID=UPI0023F91B9B|nr:hypothetical protein [Runella sp. MFBS21]MDF7817930.1 hypothetical protein [Runella sp. MFBS21]